MTDDDLILRLASRLESTDPQATAVALSALPTFQGDLGWLEALFEGATQLPPVSEQLEARLDALFDEHAVRGRPVVVSALPIHDSRREGELVGVRSGHPSISEAWTVIYSGPGADLIVDGRPLANGTTRVSGRLTGLSPENDAQFEIAGAALSESVETDRRHRFILGELDDDTYDFVIRSDRLSITWTLALGE